MTAVSAERILFKAPVIKESEIKIEYKIDSEGKNKMASTFNLY